MSNQLFQVDECLANIADEAWECVASVARVRLAKHASLTAAHSAEIEQALSCLSSAGDEDDNDAEAPGGEGYRPNPTFDDVEKILATLDDARLLHNVARRLAGLQFLPEAEIAFELTARLGMFGAILDAATVKFMRSMDPLIPAQYLASIADRALVEQVLLLLRAMTFLAMLNLFRQIFHMAFSLIRVTSGQLRTKVNEQVQFLVDKHLQGRVSTPDRLAWNPAKADC